MIGENLPVGVSVNEKHGCLDLVDDFNRADFIEIDAGPNPNGRVAAPWGCIGLLPNPEREPDELLAAWRTCLTGQPRYSAPSHLKSEGPVLDESRRLLMKWPRTVEGGPLDLDFVLATATDPELVVPRQPYPSASRVAAAWIADRHQKTRQGKSKDQEVKYFLENRKHGIWTFQDDMIRTYLSGAGIVNGSPDG